MSSTASRSESRRRLSLWTRWDSTPGDVCISSLAFLGSPDSLLDPLQTSRSLFSTLRRSSSQPKRPETPPPTDTDEASLSTPPTSLDPSPAGVPKSLPRIPPPPPESSRHLQALVNKVSRHLDSLARALTEKQQQDDDGRKEIGVQTLEHELGWQGSAKVSRRTRCSAYRREASMTSTLLRIHFRNSSKAAGFPRTRSTGIDAATFGELLDCPTQR